MSRRRHVDHAGRGVKVLAVDRDADGLDALRAEAGDTIETVVADVTREADVHAYADAARAAFGVVDGFFNNAGVAGARAGRSSSCPSPSGRRRCG